MRVAAALATASVLGLALAGCTTMVFDRAAVEENIQEEVLNQTGITLTDVECPESPSMEVGSTFECEITADDGSTAIVDVVVEDEEGTVSWEVRD